MLGHENTQKLHPRLAIFNLEESIAELELNFLSHLLAKIFDRFSNTYEPR